MSIGSKKLYCRVSVCVVVCRWVIYVSTGSRKIGLLSVGVCRHVSAGCLCVGRFKKIVFLCVSMCRHVSAGCLCVGRFKKIVLLSVGVCRHVSAGCLCVDRFKKNCIVECRCVSSCVGRLFMCR